MDFEGSSARRNHSKPWAMATTLGIDQLSKGRLCNFIQALKGILCGIVCQCCPNSKQFIQNSSSVIIHRWTSLSTKTGQAGTPHSHVLYVMLPQNQSGTCQNDLLERWQLSAERNVRDSLAELFQLVWRFVVAPYEWDNPPWIKGTTTREVGHVCVHSLLSTCCRAIEGVWYCTKKPCDRFWSTDSTWSGLCSLQLCDQSPGTWNICQRSYGDLYSLFLGVEP